MPIGSISIYIYIYIYKSIYSIRKHKLHVYGPFMYSQIDGALLFTPKHAGRLLSPLIPDAPYTGSGLLDRGAEGEHGVRHTSGTNTGNFAHTSCSMQGPASSLAEVCSALHIGLAILQWLSNVALRYPEGLTSTHSSAIVP